jgi:acetoin utilization deacetylase AcuC-like enzyme
MRLMALGTAIIYSNRYLDHDTGPFHPESPARLQGIMERLERNETIGKQFGVMIDPKPASRKEIELVHNTRYVDYVKESCEKGVPRLDSDTPICPESYDVALLAAGGLLLACEKILAGEFSNAFALVRPPGHHAGINGRALTASSAGFCLFNNIAIAARKLTKDLGFDRVLILDFDCHHGNGTQEIFYTNPSVMYTSLHQDGRTLFPGTGSIQEVGEGKGKGYTVNIPFPPGSGDDAFAKAMDEVVEPVARQFDPKWLLVSVGFDALHDDPISNMDLSSQGYRDLFEKTIRLANSLCHGRCLVTLEGGYGKTVPDAALAAISAMSKVSYDPDDKRRKTLPRIVEKVELVLGEVEETLSPYWKIG